MPARRSSRACRPRAVAPQKLLLALLCASALATACFDDSRPPQADAGTGTPPTPTETTPLPPKLRCAPDAAAIAAADGQLQLASDCHTATGAQS
ncbi:MAG: hypothetical protein Q7J29_03155 [Stagnimonas sp.]|nr:hypothetical protein [Stagnimonas sp.]